MNRIALWTDESYARAGGYDVIAVCEDESGYFFYSGPWESLEDARAYVDEHNAARGISHEDALAILISSMR